MNISVVNLFEYTRLRVTDQDIINFSPRDPGYPDYVKLWTEILRSGTIPQQWEFELSEVIELTGFWAPERTSDPERFRCYRRFTSAVAAAMIHYGHHSENVRVANHLARDLIIDLDLTSQRHLTLLRSVAESSREVLSTTNFDVAYPFFTFASMFFAQKAQDWDGADLAATQLIKDESAVRRNMSTENDQFLLGLSFYNQHNDDWLTFAQELKNPKGHEDTQLVIEALTSKRESGPRE
jgi:hypothetical protein